MIGNIVEETIFAIELVMRGWTAKLIIDTSGLPYTYPILKALSRQRTRIIAYTHYPVITAEMIKKNQENTRPELLQKSKLKIESSTWKRNCKVR